MPNQTSIIVPLAGVEQLRQALGQVHSAIGAVIAELEWAQKAAPERIGAIVLRATALGRIARDASAIADESLFAVAGGAAPVPSLDPEDAAKGSGPHQRADTEPGDDTEPGRAS